MKSSDNEDDFQSDQWVTYKGTVTEDKDKNSVKINVFVPGLTPAATGRLASATSTESITLQDQDGVSSTSTSTVSNHVTAIWWGASNRAYPPDVVAGEEVTVKRYADSDVFYWESNGRNDELRTTETVRFRVSNDKKGQKELTDQNTYFAEVSTDNGHIRIHTSKSNGEKYTYDIYIDTKGNRIYVGDDIGNNITLESDTPRVKLANKDGTFVDLFQKDVIMLAPRDVVIRAGRQALFQAPNVTFGNTEGTGVCHIKSKSYHVSSTDFVIDSSSIGLNGSVKASNIVSGTVRASSYSTGSPGSSYKGGTVDLGSGAGTAPKNVPDTGEGANNRRAAAYEQVSDALNVIYQSLNQVQREIGVPTVHGNLPSLASESVMPKLRGE